MIVGWVERITPNANGSWKTDAPSIHLSISVDMPLFCCYNIFRTYAFPLKVPLIRGI